MINDNELKSINYLTGLIGSPVSHSLSPRIHKELFDKYNMVGYDYVLIDSKEKGLEKTIKSLDKRFIGFNVTMPDKVNILNFLDDVSEEVKEIGAANTIKINNGKLYGFNTDGKGFLNALKKRNVDIANKCVVIYGAGGAAKAINYELIKNGATVKILHRPSKEKLYENLYDCDIFINASPCGMDSKTSPIEDFSIVKKDIFVADIIYEPSNTKLLMLAKEKGHNFMNGYDMLYEQANISFNIFHNVF